MNLPVMAAVALGGALGSLARYAVGVYARGHWPGWPWGTLAVNVIGSLLIGMLFALFADRATPEWLRLGLVTGVLGGFTTFSAFSLETMELLRTDGVVGAGGYVLASLVLGLGACALGIWATRQWLA
jgi:CrcB protein